MALPDELLMSKDAVKVVNGLFGQPNTCWDLFQKLIFDYAEASFSLEMVTYHMILHLIKIKGQTILMILTEKTRNMSVITSHAIKNI